MAKKLRVKKSKEEIKNELKINLERISTYSIPSEHKVGLLVCKNCFINDLFFITTLNVASMNLVIMNRWGNILYDETNANPTWDGENHPDGVYYYMYTATGINGEILKGRGFFHLVNNN